MQSYFTTPVFSKIILLLLCWISFPFQSQSQVQFGAHLGLYFQKIEIKNDTENNFITKNPVVFSGNIRVVKPISKVTKDLRIQFDLSYRVRNFSTELDSFGRVEIAEREIQLEPIISRKIPIKSKEWSPLVKGGFNANFAVIRRAKDENNNEYKWTGFEDLFTSNLVLGGGIMHNKGFFTELAINYAIVKPDGTPEGPLAIDLEWSPLAFNLTIGFLFN